MADPIIKRALLSVTDKTGITEFASALVKEFGVRVSSRLAVRHACSKKRASPSRRSMQSRSSPR